MQYKADAFMRVRLRPGASQLAKPIHETMDCIENEKKNEASNQLALVQKLRQHLR